MAFGDICKVIDCNKFVTKKSGALCEQHRYRWEKFKSFDEPLQIKHELPFGIVKICNIHGNLNKEQVQIYERKGRILPQIRCYQCYLIAGRKSKKKNSIEKKEENSVRRKAYYQKNIDKQHAMNRKSRFGITLEHYQDMLINQNNLCAICKMPETVMRKGKIKNLSVDHCHYAESQGIMKIRGLLCSRCNIAFGAFRESTEILQRAIDYATFYNTA
jgi:hypothetical protein